MADDAPVDTNDTDQTVAEFEQDDEGIVKRWLAEWEIADEEEETWRNESNDTWKIYEGDEEKSFNVLWSNTETVLPSVYNSVPKPDVRRRFRDPDPQGKYASKITERALDYSVDVYPFNDEVKKAVLDAEITGRGILRNVYRPQFAPMDQAKPSLWSRIKAALGGGKKEPQDVLVDERAELIHWQWDKFRRGPGRTWTEVPWVGFLHEFTREMAIEEFGRKVASKLTYNAIPAAEKITGKEAKEAKALFRVCVVYEIHDKISKRVLWIAPCYKDKPCKVSSDELKLDGFYPMPAPLYSIFNSRSLIPRSRYRMYKKQAQTLEDISARLDKCVKALKLRGAYAANLPELKDMIEGTTDGELIPVENVSAVMDSGGLDKMIWIMPIERLKAVIEALIVARNECKQAIYEIVGLSDIVRGATDPDETASAQRLKSQYSSIRLENYKREVERIVRDGLRIMADMICGRFSDKTLQTITQVKLPTQVEKQQAQQIMMQAQAAQQQPPEEIAKLLQIPTWEEVMQILKSDFLRTARVDIETDSTVAESIDRDMSSINETLDILGKFLQTMQPVLQSGMLPVAAAKETALSIVRKSRMGQVVEDAFEGMQMPSPEAQPAPDDSGAQAAAQQAKAGQQKAEIKLEGEKQARAADKREYDLALREQELKLREEALAQQEQQLQQQAQQVQQAGQQVEQQAAALSTVGAPGAGMDPMQQPPGGAMLS